MIEIRSYEGSAADAAAFWSGAVSATSATSPRTLWTADLLEWQGFGEGGQNRDLMIGAYQGSRLVGTLFSRRLRFRVGASEVPGTLGSWMAVDAQHRRQGIARRMFDELWRRTQDGGMALEIGFADVGQVGDMVLRSRARIVRLGRLRWWTRVLDAPAYAAWTPGARWWISPLGVVLSRPRWPGLEVGVRACKERDLPDCLGLAQRLTEQADLALAWDAGALGQQLLYPRGPRTLVIEEHGRVAGFINYLHQEEFVRSPLGVANIDLLAVGGLRHERQRALLQAALARMADEGATYAAILGLPCYPTRLLLECGFVPLRRNVEVTGVFFQGDVRLDGLRTLCLYVR